MSLRNALTDAPCVAGTQTSQQHERIKIPIPLDPLTNYVLDMEARPVAIEDEKPLFRRHFGTSRYASASAMALAVRGATPRHRRLAGIAPLKGLAGELSDHVFEDALRAARWGDLVRPTAPRVTVIWGDPTPVSSAQPAAILIETPEPLWRERMVPGLVGDAQGTQRYQLVPAPWIGVTETSAGQVTSLVHSTEGGRTLALLRENARGATVTLSLQRHRHLLIEGDETVETTTLFTAALVAPPWEGQA
jgi:hypothetical protein